MAGSKWIAAAIIAIVVSGAAHAQNCANAKFGVGATRKPQNTARTIVGKSLDDIRERGWIMFAVYADYAPYSYKADGKLTGVDVDVGHLIAKALGVKARFYATLAGENVSADLRFNVWKGRLIGGPIANVMLHVPYDRELACRNEQVVLNGQYFNERLAIAYRKSAYPDSPPVPAYFRYDTVGVENDTISDFYLTGLAGGQLTRNIRRFPSYDDAMAALRSGKIKAVMGPIGQLEHGADDKVGVHVPPLVGLAKSQWTVGIAVRHSWRPLSYAVDDAVRSAVKDGRMAAIFKKHGLSYTAPKW